MSQWVPTGSNIRVQGLKRGYWGHLEKMEKVTHDALTLEFELGKGGGEITATLFFLSPNLHRLLTLNILQFSYPTLNG